MLKTFKVLFILLCAVLLTSTLPQRKQYFPSDIVLTPISHGGDCIQEMDSARDLAALRGGRIIFTLGNYPISRPWVLAQVNAIGTDFNQIGFNVIGEGYAFSTQPGYTANILPQYTDAPAIIMQANKGTRIENLNIVGKYRFPLGLNQVQVDTLRFDEWKDICSDNRTAAYVGVVIDPFSDPVYFANGGYSKYEHLSQYYIPGMSRSGSTGVTIDGCSISQFVVGMLVSGAWQYNGELIKLTNSSLDNCKVAYACSQAQSKDNVVEFVKVWGNTHTVFDGMNYGMSHTDASTSPYISHINVAQFCHQFINLYSKNFSTSIRDVFMEGTFKIGIVNGLKGTLMDNVQATFPNWGGSVPSPDFYYAGYNTTWIVPTLNIYNNLPTRIVLDFPTNTFEGGSLNAPPIIWNTYTDPKNGQFARFRNVGMGYYKSGGASVLDSNGYDVGGRHYLGGSPIMHINRANFTGWFLALHNTAKVLSVNDLLVCNSKRYEDQYSTIIGSNYTLGYVTTIIGDTVKLMNMGVGIHEGEQQTPVYYTIKTPI